MMKKVFLLLAVACMFFSCGLITGGNTDENRGGGKSDSPLTPPVIPESDKVTAKVVKTAQILQDGESSDTVMNQTKRWWKLTEPVRIETKTDYNGAELTLGDDQILLTSYSLYPITGIEVFDGAGADANYLFTIGDISELAQNVYTIPEGGESTTTGKYVVKSNDEHYRKIAGGKMQKTLYFAKSNSLWGLLGPLEAREYVAFWTNLAFTFSSPEFETLLKNYKKLTDLEFTDDHNSNGTITKHDLATDTVARDEIKNRLFVEKTLGIGLVGSETYDSNGTKGGQAYANSLAITPVNLTVAYYLGLGVGVHEFGHTINYDHESSFSKDMQTYAGGLSACFIRLQKAPYYNIDFVGYHKPENESVRNLKVPDQKMLTNKYNESKLQRDNANYYQKYVGNVNGVYVGYEWTPGRNPDEGKKQIQPAEQTVTSDQYINAFEKAVYKNSDIYPDLYKALKMYFDDAKTAGIL